MNMERTLRLQNEKWGKVRIKVVHAIFIWFLWVHDLVRSLITWSDHLYFSIGPILCSEKHPVNKEKANSDCVWKVVFKQLAHLLHRYSVAKAGFESNSPGGMQLHLPLDQHFSFSNSPLHSCHNFHKARVPVKKGTFTTQSWFIPRAGQGSSLNGARKMGQEKIRACVLIPAHKGTEWTLHRPPEFWHFLTFESLTLRSFNIWLLSFLDAVPHLFKQ